MLLVPERKERVTRKNAEEVSYKSRRKVSTGRGGEEKGGGGGEDSHPRRHKSSEGQKQTQSLTHRDQTCTPD